MIHLIRCAREMHHDLFVYNQLQSAANSTEELVLPFPIKIIRSFVGRVVVVSHRLRSEHTGNSTNYRAVSRLWCEELSYFNGCLL